MIPKQFHDDLEGIVGQARLSLKRTHGSCFFMEFGEHGPAAGGASHGAHSLLVEMPGWRFAKRGEVLVASDDKQAKIDEVFSSISLGSVQRADVIGDLFDFEIEFNSGILFETFLASSDKADLGSLWIFYIAGKGAWAVDEPGVVSFEPDSE